jgi:hypothetical protein
VREVDFYFSHALRALERALNRDDVAVHCHIHLLASGYGINAGVALGDGLGSVPIWIWL